MLAEFEAILTKANSDDTKPLEWAVQRDTSAAISTIVEPITPVYLTTRPSRTRLWFVGICLMLMGIAYGFGMYFSKDRQALSADNRKSVRAENQQPSSEPNRAKPEPAALAGGPVTALAFYPTDSTRIYWGTSNGEQKIYSLLDHGEPRTLSSAGIPRSDIRQIVYWNSSREGKNWWLSVYGGEMHFFDAETPERKLPDAGIGSVSDRNILAVAIRPRSNGSVLALAVQNRKQLFKGGIAIRLLNEKPEDVSRQTDDARPPTCLAFSADGKLLLAGQDNGMAHVWRVAVRAKNFSSEQEAFIESSGSFFVGPDKIVAIAGLDETRFAAAIGDQVWLCDAETVSKIDLAPLHNGKQPVTALAISQTNNRLACAEGNSVFVYDLKTGNKIKEIADHTATVTAIAFDEKGERLASGDQEGKIFISRLKE